MTRPEIEKVLHSFILEQFPAARNQGLTATSSLIDQGIIDSLGVLEIVTFIEQQFGVSLADDEMVSDHFDSIPALAELVSQKIRSDVSCSS